jgi:prepilin-type N-terminal cleavage/methylation domain-containing protein
MRHRGMVNRRGFTLIELFMVVTIVGLLVVIVVPKFWNTRELTYGTLLKSDLRNLANQQESHFQKFGVYSADLATLGMIATTGTVLSIIEASAAGWSATATNPSAGPIVCAAFGGNVLPVAPATREGVVECTE